MFQLRFLGEGAALNAARGNTAAFFIIEQELFLLDCGGTVLGELDRRDILRGVKAIQVVITHCHCDHIGSLADLIYYAKYRYQIPLNLLWDSEYERADERLQQVYGYLRYYGVLDNFGLGRQFQVKDTKDYRGYGNLESIHLLPTTHHEDVHSVSVVIRSQGERIFYSGDTNTLATLEAAEAKFGPMEQIYLEVCGRETPVHLDLGKLVAAFKPEERFKVTVMHFDDGATGERAWALGFQLPIS
jgi:ribonuclease BN (tRNA processing enzyme)